MARFDIHPSKTALLIIDMQNVFLKPGAILETPSGREMIPKLNKLMKVCRSKGMPVIFTVHVYRRDGSDKGVLSREFTTGKACIDGTEGVEMYNELEIEDGDIFIRKSRYNAFIGTDLDLVLHSKGIDTLIIGGVITYMCCDTTARNAGMMDYKVIFLSDGNATPGIPDMGWGPIPAEEVQRVCLSILAQYYAQVSSIDDVTRQLQ